MKTAKDLYDITLPMKEKRMEELKIIIQRNVEFEVNMILEFCEAVALTGVMYADYTWSDRASEVIRIKGDVARKLNELGFFTTVRKVDEEKVSKWCKYAGSQEIHVNWDIESKKKKDALIKSLSKNWFNR